MKGRWRQVERLLPQLAAWAAGIDDIRGLALVGSYAYRRPRMSSDVDLVLLTDNPDRYGAWLGRQSPFSPARLTRIRTWGPVTECRFRHRSGLHIELGVTTPSWASVDPLDAGTARVISDGLRTVYDPDALLETARVASEYEPRAGFAAPDTGPGWQPDRCFAHRGLTLTPRQH